MFLTKPQLVLLAALFGAATVHCGKWPFPPRYSSESFSHSRSLSSEEYHGANLPPLQLGGVPLPAPVYVPNHVHKPHHLASPHFSELIKGNLPQINEAVGANRQLSNITKVKKIPIPEGEMYYVKGYFTTETGYRNKCSFFLYSKDTVSKVMDAHCY